MRLTVVSAKSRSPGNSIILEIAAAYYSSASQILVDYGAHLLKLKHSSNRPVYFREIMHTLKA